MNQYEAAMTASTQLVIETFRSFRDELLTQYGVIQFERKADYSQVTELDVKIERTLRAALETHFPQFGFLGEETGDGRRDNTPYWVVDPIDATSSFIRGLPNCVNMAALIVDDQPVIAVLYDFVNDVLYEAYAGKGAFRNGEPLQSARRALDSSAVYLHRAFVVSESERQQLIDAHVEAYRPFGASGKAYILIAEGKIDGYVLFGSRVSMHDNAPGVLLAREAGAVIETASGAPWHVGESDFAIGNPEVTSFFSRLAKRP